MQREVMEAYNHLACTSAKFDVNSRYIGYRKIKQFYPITFYDFWTWRPSESNFHFAM